jgi:hypothetical protein
MDDAEREVKGKTMFDLRDFYSNVPDSKGYFDKK